MHIPDGVLSVPLLLAGAAATVAGCAMGLRGLEQERIPQVALVAATLFVAALVHFPVGPSSVHLMLTGLAGVMLGWAVFPAVVVALLLQAVLFGFGGLAVLGVNAVSMALPAVLCGLLFTPLQRRAPRLLVPAAALVGGLAVLLSALLTAGALLLGGPDFGTSAWLVVAAALPVMVVEGVVTAAAVGLLRKVRPETLAGLAPLPSHA